MSLPDSYTQKPGAIAAYFDAVLDAQPPDRFSIRFLENLGFTSTNDRLFLSILKDLGFLNVDGVPQQRYYEFMDRTRSRIVLAEGIRDAYSDLFAVNTKANELTPSDVKNKLRTLYAGKKTNNVIDRIAMTFSALCEYADFSKPASAKPPTEDTKTETTPESPQKKLERAIKDVPQTVSLDSLQYHINIVLPETRDQGVYDAIFRSLREHLGTRHE
ncbi:MAG: DUF5343 domain-containing protein [candidate division Zixibacteria bacterium]|nr:DUF5343 domain-containing protein [candidate division Zixibacteria bacterium]